MRKRIILGFLLVALLSVFFTARAVEIPSAEQSADGVPLPIDIGAIGQQEGYDDAVTARSNIDLFTESARKVSAYMAEQARLGREQAVGTLFETVQPGQTSDINRQIAGTANDFALFAQPVNYSNVKMPTDATLMPLGLIILLFAVCAVGGFIVAQVLAKRKRGKAGVH